MNPTSPQQKKHIPIGFYLAILSLIIIGLLYQFDSSSPKTYSPLNSKEKEEVQSFLKEILPTLYESTISSHLSSPQHNLQNLQGLVEPNILNIQKTYAIDLQNQFKTQLKTQDNPTQISTSATITHITKAIKIKNPPAIYVEIQGKVSLSLGSQSKETPIQWRCLLLIQSPNENPKKFYLRQISEQEPGTANEIPPQ